MHAVALLLHAAKPAANAFKCALAIDDQSFLFVGEITVRFFDRDAFALTKVQQTTQAPGFAIPWFDGAVAERFFRIRNHQIEIDIDDPPETSTGFAGSQRAVEGKKVRYRFRIRKIAMRAMQMVAERLAAPILGGQKQIQFSLAVMKGLFEGVANAFFILYAKSESVDHDLEKFAVGRCIDCL